MEELVTDPAVFVVTESDRVLPAVLYTVGYESMVSSPSVVVHKLKIWLAET